VNHQIRLWIFMGRPNSSLNYAKYQLNPWICQTSIKNVSPSKCSVSHVDMSPYMLCCLVHVAKRKPRVQGLIWWKWKIFSFHFYFFMLFQFCPCITHTFFLIFHSETSKTSLTLLLPAKIFFILTSAKSSSSPVILMFFMFLCSVVVKGTTFPLVYQVSMFVFTLFFVRFFVLSFYHLVYLVFVIIDACFVLLFLSSNSCWHN